MKDVWKEITESLEVKIVALVILSLFVLFLLSAVFVSTLSREKDEEYQEVTDISHPNFNSIQTNFTQ